MTAKNLFSTEASRKSGCLQYGWQITSGWLIWSCLQITSRKSGCLQKLVLGYLILPPKINFRNWLEVLWRGAGRKKNEQTQLEISSLDARRQRVCMSRICRSDQGFADHPPGNFDRYLTKPISIWLADLWSDSQRSRSDQADLWPYREVAGCRLCCTVKISIWLAGADATGDRRLCLEEYSMLELLAARDAAGDRRLCFFFVWEEKKI